MVATTLKIDKSDSLELIFMAYDLYPLSPSLKPCEPIDTIDTRYLTQTYVVLVNPLKNVLRIELYNEKWFNRLLPPSAPPFTYKHTTLKIPNEQVTHFPSLVKFHKDTNTSPPKLLLQNADHVISYFPFSLALHN